MKLQKSPKIVSITVIQVSWNPSDDKAKGTLPVSSRADIQSYDDAIPV